jgi:translation initiation factor IF-3
VPQVRVIGVDGEQAGVMSTRQALELAEDAGLDLVEIAPNGEPPVCRIMDYGKFRFEQAKKASIAKKKQKNIQVKEVKFRPGTEEADYQVKMRNVRRFLEEGDKVKLTLRFRGREMAHKELGAQMLERIEKELEEEIVVEQRPRLEGRQMVMLISPKKH